MFSIAFMYLCVFALLPFIAFALHLMASGDRLREQEATARVAATVETPAAELAAPAADVTTIHARPVATSHAVA